MKPAWPTRSAWIHMRFAFAILLLPVYLFALGQTPFVQPLSALLVFLAWHVFAYPASNGYNSYFDRDEESIALVARPPQVDKSLYYLSLIMETTGILLAALVSIEFASAVLVYGLLSKAYSHPGIRLKKYPVISFLVVFVFQGAFVYWSTYSALSGLSLFHGWTDSFFLAGLISSCLVGASYPITQVYQHAADKKRGDRTLSMVLGVKGSFIFSAILFLTGFILMAIYWNLVYQVSLFYIFLIFALPVVLRFTSFFLKVRRDPVQANYTNTMAFVMISSGMMICYFLVILIIRFF